MLRPQLTYANVMSTIAAFLALGGTSYAVVKLPRDSVGSRELKPGAVTADTLAAGVAISGPRGPRGATGPTGPAGPQGPTGGIGSNGPWQALPLLNGWTNFGFEYEVGGFRRSANGDVQLRGVIKRSPDSGATIAQLPVGLRPGRSEVFTVLTGGLTELGRINVNADGTVVAITASTGNPNYVSLSGVVFTPAG